MQRRHLPRRHFSQQLLSAAGLATAGLLVPRWALAQAPVAGQHYVRLNTPASVSLPPGKKVEVVEFFWYGCPHCFAFEPTVEKWVKTLPADVHFRHVPAAFTAVYQLHQRMFYALEDMGQLGAVHRKIFNAIHLENKRLNTEGDVIAFLKTQGVDEAKFTETLKSFSVNTKAARAKQLAEAYKIDGVPTVGINGRFYTSPGLAGGNDRAAAVMDHLIGLARQG